MSTALADLFSGSSPPPQPTTPPRSPSRSPPPGQRNANDPLFFSPGDTPDRPRQNISHVHIPSPPRPISFNGNQTNEPNDPDFGLRSDSLPPFDDPLAGLGIGIGADDGEQPAKKRRVMAKIDQERLMGERGFPALMKAAKRFKSKGKGHEASDLRDLLGIYQLWAHGMFPKGDFGGTIARVETICRTRRMEIAMKGYREAFYPPASRSPSPPGLSPLHTSPPPLPDLDLEHEDPDEEDNEAVRRSSEPLFDHPDEPDVDELMAMEELEREQTSRPTQKIGDEDDDPPPPPEEEDEWEGLYD